MMKSDCSRQWTCPKSHCANEWPVTETTAIFIQPNEVEVFMWQFFDLSSNYGERSFRHRAQHIYIPAAPKYITADELPRA
ncbi:hypothetical protein QE152_g13071 [Popillia japonica]|uniref:Uncharacterized protein n=1 Tax=Popillia japonica TaxID=7064 RepID=A0AAW1LE57_POPJA